MVQNTEVQLNCSRVRIGSLLANCVGQVRVRADNASGIYFTIKSECMDLCQAISQTFFKIAEVQSIIVELISLS